MVFNSHHLTDKNIYNSLAHYYNSDDSDTSMIRESYFKPSPNATSTPKCNNKNIKSIFFKLKIICINCNSLRSVDKRAELNCLVSHHNPHIILGRNLGRVHIFHLVKSSIKDLNISAGIESWAVVASSS